MTVYYRRPTLLITHEVFKAFDPYLSLLVQELRDIHVVRSAQGFRPHRVAGAGGSAIVALAIGWQLHDAHLGWIALAVALAGSSAICGSCLHTRPPTFELAARYGDHHVTLYRSADPEAFGQVRRALLRAIEQQQDS